MSLRRLPGWAFTLAAILPAIPFGLAASQLDTGGKLLAMGVMLVWAMGWLIYGWTRLDEASREAYKFAWFWGGAVGLVVLELVAFAGLLMPPLGQVIADQVTAQARPDAIPQTGFFLGVFTASLVQGVGFALAWLGWWLSRRMGR